MVSILLLSACVSTEENGKEGPSGGPTSQGEGQAKGSSLSLNPEVLHGRLENGLSYYVRENGKPAKRVQLRLVVDAGSVDERDNERGLAHFVEHMAFNGTESYDKNSIIDYLESIGMSFGPDVNAYTSFDRTVYSLDLPTDSSETVEKGFDILKEWAYNIAFDPQEVEKERAVIVEEWRSGRGASARLRDKWWPVLAENSRYAERLPIGSMEIVRNAPPERLEGFYDRWYRPERMAVVVVGDISKDRALELIQSTFATAQEASPETEEKLQRPEYRIDPPQERRIVVATDPEASNITVRLLGIHPSFDPSNREEYRDSLSMSLYRSMISARMDELSEGEDPPFINGYFSRGPLVRSNDASAWAATAYEGELPEAIEALAGEARRLELFGFTEGELERAKERLRSNFEQAYKERGKTPSSRYVSEYIRHFLRGEMSPGIEKEWELVQEMLPEIDLEAVERIHRDYMRVDSRVVVVTGPEKEGLRYPGKKEISSILEEMEEARVSPYSDDFEGRSLLAERPEAGRILEEHHHGEGGYHELELSNGARILYRKTDLKNSEILFSAFSSGGTSLVPTEKYFSAALAPRLVTACGLGDFSPVDLKKLLSGKQVSLSPYIDRYYEGFNGSSSPEDLELLFQQLHLYHSDLRRDTALFESYRRRLSAALRNRKNSPGVRFQDELRRLLYEDHPRAQPLSSERVEAIDMEDTFRSFADRFSDAGDFTYVFVGNIDEEQLRSYAETYLASLPSGEQEKSRDRGLRFFDEDVSKRVFSGKEPKSRVALLYSAPYDWSVENNHRLSSLKSMLQIRLREVIREEAGGTYGVSVSSSSHKLHEEEFALWISFSCEPDRARELIDRVDEELNRAIEREFEAKYAEKVREKQLNDWEKSKEENSYWLATLSASAKYDLPVENLVKRGERIERLSPSFLRASAEDFLLGARRLELILYPEARKPEE